MAALGNEKQLATFTRSFPSTHTRAGGAEAPDRRSTLVLHLDQASNSRVRLARRATTVERGEPRRMRLHPFGKRHG